MSDFLIGAIVLLSFVLLSLRPLTADTRTWTDIRARARRAGWGRVFVGVLRVVIVTSLLVLVRACHMCWRVAAVVGSALTLAALIVEAMSSPAPSRVEAS
ncbi:hypothetical protein AB0C27_40370 [Nonomuraea sp. NPDC048882]|uniref:hypothetical protein n=1 Tax=Nonomuraea sp. NPDC048882 TaxID=3154347 RepID=UPI00340C67C2